MLSNSPLKYVFWNILGTSYLPLYLSCIGYQVLKHNLVLFGGNRQVCAHRGKIVLCHCRCSSCSGCYLGVHQHEQRGAGRQEEDYDGGWCVHLPDCSSPGIASVLRYRIMTHNPNNSKK